MMYTVQATSNLDRQNGSTTTHSATRNKGDNIRANAGYRTDKPEELNWASNNTPTQTKRQISRRSTKQTRSQKWRREVGLKVRTPNFVYSRRVCIALTPDHSSSYHTYMRRIGNLEGLFHYLVVLSAVRHWHFRKSHSLMLHFDAQCSGASAI